MALFRYYFSHGPGGHSPPTNELLSVNADSRADALQRIADRDGAPLEWPAVWVHLLIWSDGEQRGFESTQLR